MRKAPIALTHRSKQLLDSGQRTLCIDLDGTLINTDLVWECFLKVLKQAPWRLMLIPIWLLGGKQRLKSELYRNVHIDVSALPYNRAVLDFIEENRSNYSAVVLVTGTIESLALSVAAHLGIFRSVIASDSRRNLTGSAKAEELTTVFAEGGYDYVANERADLAAWAHAARAITVNASRTTRDNLRQLPVEHLDLGGRSASVLTWLRAVRLHQWAKNALLFVPLVTAHRILDIHAMTMELVAFLAFGLCASGTYVLNDLLDLESDRHHATKRTRPFAAGEIPIPTALTACVMLLASGFSVAVALPKHFVAALAIYVVATIAYSLKLKRVASLDVVVLAGLYTVRVIAGAFAIGVVLSFWLLAFSMFVFLCLAIVKRVSELQDLQARNEVAIKGREYSVADAAILQVMGVSSGYISVLVLALYINSREIMELYASPRRLWLMVPLMLLWVTRLWVVTARGHMHEDPIVWAIKDPETWATGAAAAVVLLLATLAGG